MDRLRNQVSRAWTTFKSVPQVVQGYVRDRLDDLPRNYEEIPRTSNLRSQIRKEAILEIGEEYDGSLTSRCATLERLYETLTNFGIQMQDMNNSSNARADHYLVQSGYEMFNLLSDLVYSVSNGLVFVDIYDTRKKLKIYCKTLLALLSVRYELRWVASLMLIHVAENTQACSEVLSQVNCSLVVLDYQIQRHLYKPLLHVYDPHLHTLDDDFIVDMIQCLDMYKEELEKSLLPLVTTLRARLGPLGPNKEGRYHPPVPKIDLC